MMRFALVMFCFVTLLPGVVFAESTPQGSKLDHRIKHIAYNPSDVVKIVGHYGYSTHIQFANGEKVESVALGDSLAWEVSPVGSHIFMKPRENKATTNMTVLTTKHVYNFALTALRTDDINAKKMYFQVSFNYPIAKKQQEEQQRLAAQRAAKANKVKEDLNSTDNEAVNWNYSGCGSDSVKPDLVWDDGTFTYLKYGANRDMPAVFIEQEDKAGEALVNTNVEGDVIVIHRTGKRFVLRKGKSVACIINNDYDPDGISNRTGTTNKNIHRVIKGAN